ncbi:MAG TPA: hypothetical protein VFH61_04580 [Thermoleophilia bacterium]|nr:hypothetical protein [Thermoleophilia bacterium]
MSRHPYGILESAKRQAAEQAQKAHEPILVVATGRVLVRVVKRKYASFVRSHPDAHIVAEVYPEVTT